MSKLSSRPAPPIDADAILAVGVARDIADLGAPDWTLEDVRDEMSEAVAAWVAEDEGEVVAAALLESDGFARVLVHPYACGLGFGTHLLELVGASAPAGTLLRQELPGSNGAARALLEAAGYEPEQHYWRMVLSLDAPVASTPLPPGVSTRPYAPEEDLPEAEALVRSSLPDLTGNLPARRLAADLSTVARANADGSLAGVVLCERREAGQGFVAYLAVDPVWRGRGLGRALLAGAFEQMRATGLVSAALGVNGANSSATALYESVGMRIDSRADRYAKRLP